MLKKHIIKTLEDTENLAHRFSKKLKAGDVVAFEGNLGAGKTTFIKYLTDTFHVDEYVNSPTFTIINEYDGDLKINHIDFYRINILEDLYEIGIEEYFNDKDITLIEWANLFLEVLPEEYYLVKMELVEDGKRNIEIRKVKKDE